MRTKKNWLYALVVLCITLLSTCMLFTGCQFLFPETEDPKATVTEITLDASNAEVVFDLNEEFSASGLLVKANYSDNTSKAVFAEDCQISEPDMTTRGTKTVTVTYEGKSAEYSITVREFKDITLDTASVRTRFNANETFDYNGLVVYANYYDDVASSVVTDYTVSTPDLSTFGEKTVTVTYNGQTAEYTVAVANAPMISSAELVEDGDKLYFKLTGTAQGFTADQITLDLQEMFGAWERVVIEPTATVNAADGTFEVLGNITDSAMTSSGDYMIHIFFAGEQFDVVDIQNKADQTVTVGDVAYQIKSEQWFDNNTSYFVVLRCGNEADFSDKASFEMTSAYLEVREDKVYYVVNGNYAVYTESDFGVDVENTSTWLTTVLTSTTTLDAENGTFSIAADVTDVLTSDIFLTHILAGQKKGNLMNYDGFTEKTVTLGGKTYTLKAQDVFNNGTDFYLILTATAAEDGEQPNPNPDPEPTPDPDPVEKSATATSATIENREGKLYFVVGGTYSGYTEADFDFDVQESANAWATTDLTPEVTLDAEAGTFTMAADVSFMAVSRYFSHLKIAGISSDFLLNVAEKTVSVGIYDYTIKSEDIFNNGNIYVTITKAINASASHTITSAKIESREGKLYIAVSGTYSGYTQADFDLDVQEAANSWPTTDLTPEVTLDATAGTFTVAADISSMSPSKFMFKLKLVGTAYDVRDIQITENTVTIGNYDYTIKIEDVYGDDKVDNIVVVYKTSKVTLSYTITSATIEEKDGKVYLTVSGAYEGYTQADFDMDIQEADGMWPKTEVTPEVVLDEVNGTYTMSADVTDIITGSNFFAHVILPGVYADVANLANVTEQSVTIGNKTYTLKIVDLFANGAQVVTLSMSEAAQA